jgi:hypothetical protein
MRFGKTFATYKLAEKMKWKRVLVLTYKPAVRDAWRDDLSSHIDFSDWVFASRDSAVDPDIDQPMVWFASFQDLLGTTSKGGVKEHNIDSHLIDWDCIVLDEYHFGAWQGAAKELCSTVPLKDSSTKFEEEEIEKAEELSEMLKSGTPRLYSANPEGPSADDLDAGQLRLSSKNYLYLSGTPFRALTEGEFNEDAIFNWTYPNEQQAKREWDEVATHDPGYILANLSSGDTTTGSTSRILGKGFYNTKTIVNDCSFGAALLASSYHGGGKSDWYLLSKDELNKLYVSKALVGGLKITDHYWSSSEETSSGAEGSAWVQEFQSGTVFNDAWGNTNSVRPVRAF